MSFQNGKIFRFLQVDIEDTADELSLRILSLIRWSRYTWWEVLKYKKKHLEKTGGKKKTVPITFGI